MQLETSSAATKQRPPSKDMGFFMLGVQGGGVVFEFEANRSYTEQLSHSKVKFDSQFIKLKGSSASLRLCGRYSHGRNLSFSLSLSILAIPLQNDFATERRKRSLKKRQDTFSKSLGVGCLFSCGKAKSGLPDGKI